MLYIQHLGVCASMFAGLTVRTTNVRPCKHVISGKHDHNPECLPTNTSSPRVNSCAEWTRRCHAQKPSHVADTAGLINQSSRKNEPARKPGSAPAFIHPRMAPKTTRRYRTTWFTSSKVRLEESLSVQSYITSAPIGAINMLSFGTRTSWPCRIRTTSTVTLTRLGPHLIRDDVQVPFYVIEKLKLD